MTKTNLFIRKMAASAILIAFSVVITRLIPGIQLGIYRLSLGTIPIYLASIILGPLWGGIIGVAADVIGTTLFPVGSFLIYPLIGAGLFGIIPGLLFLLLKMLRGKIKPQYLFYGIILVVIAFISIVVIVNQSITYRATMQTTATITFTLWWKILTPVVLSLIGGLFAVIFYLMNRDYQAKAAPIIACPTPYEVATMVIITDLLIDVLYGPIWKMIVFDSNLLVNLFVQSGLYILAVIIKTIGIHYLLNIYYRYLDFERFN